MTQMHASELSTKGFGRFDALVRERAGSAMLTDWASQTLEPGSFNCPSIINALPVEACSS
jgi:hypothetical protein